MGGLGGQRYEETVGFRKLLEVSEDIKLEWSLFRTAMILSAVDERGLEWPGVVRKEHLGGTKMLKKLSEQRKMRLRPCC